MDNFKDRSGQAGPGPPHVLEDLVQAELASGEPIRVVED
jgi:hypothetical protein